jgi:AcrR family transcriptional regulator
MFYKMTDKKENILNAALTLFAKEGFSGTSTSKIAKAAGVSEGLIFRHFKNKDGLLEAILLSGEERMKALLGNIIFESDPITVLENTFNLYLALIENEDEANFWKLQYKIKWEVEVYSEHKMEPLQLALTNAFKKLGFTNAELEADFLLIHMDGLATRFFLQKNFDLRAQIEFLREKYKQ